MARILSFAPFVLLLISACAMFARDNEPQNVENQTVQVPDTENRPVPSPSPTVTEPVTVKSSSKAISLAAPTKEEIRRVQSRMKATGFDPGPVDGIMGTKSMATLLRLQSGCATLNDLLENPQLDTVQQSPGTGGLSSPTNKISNQEEIRLVQVRLKEAGFDPGPIDGLWGAKTRSAVIRLRSGCETLKTFPPNLEMTKTTDGGGSMTATSKNVSVTAAPTPTGLERTEDVKLTGAGKRIASSEEVRLVQIRLKDSGFDPGPIDGMMGPQTRSALRKSQTSSASKTSPKPSSEADRMFQY
jgi:peptidoglycan hydrolase-like protein with peptidoglycan-binding domain